MVLHHYRVLQRDRVVGRWQPHEDAALKQVGCRVHPMPGVLGRVHVVGMLAFAAPEQVGSKQYSLSSKRLPGPCSSLAFRCHRGWAFTFSAGSDGPLVL